jgi:hypothetical protein
MTGGLNYYLKSKDTTNLNMALFMIPNQTLYSSLHYSCKTSKIHYSANKPQILFLLYLEPMISIIKNCSLSLELLVT